MHGLGRYAHCWARLCLRSDKDPDLAATPGTVSIAMLGLLLSALLVFSLSVTTLIPVAVAILPAPFIFAVAVFRPSVLIPKGPTDLPDFVHGHRRNVLDMGTWDQFISLLR